MRKGIAAAVLIAVLMFSVSCRVRPTGPWHPERTDYPRTIYKADQLDTIKARLGRFPYNELYNRVKWQAGRSPISAAAKFVPAEQYENANIAKSAAFVYVIDGGSIYRQKSVDILKNIPQEFDKLSFELLDRDIHVAEALMCYAQALDMLLGANALDPTERKTIEEKLGNITQKFFNNWAELICGAYEFARNNHHTKTASAIGMVAIVLNNNPMAKVWIDYAMNEVEADLESQITPDGGYAEGPNYWTYSAVNVLPFAWAYHLFSNGQAETFIDRPCLLSGLNQNGTQKVIKDFFTDWKLKAVSEWMIKIRQPDGLTPPIDDANLSGYFNAIISGVYREGVFSWDWLTSASYIVSQSCADISVDTICIYDDSVLPAEPSWTPSMIMKEGGQAVMRSGWGTDDSYVLFQAENGKARIAGYGHEHPDALNFMMYAYGKPLIIDSGYINYDNHDLVRYAKNHNVILVDGNGPEPGMFTANGADGYLKDFITTDSDDYCSAEASFSNVLHERSIVFADRKYLILFDDVTSFGIFPHQYSWLLHGNGGGSTGGTFTLADNGGTWVNGSARIKAVVISPDSGLDTSTHDDYHGFNWGVQETHAVLQADTKGKKVGLLSVLYPSGNGGIEPNIKPVPVSNGGAIMIEDDSELTLVRKQSRSDFGSEWNVSDFYGYPEFPALKCNAGQAKIAVDREGRVKKVFLNGASSYLYINGAVFVYVSSVSSSDKVLTLSFGDDRITGGVITDGSVTTVELYTGSAPVSVEGDNVTGYSFLGNGMTRIIFSPLGGKFAVYLTPETALKRVFAEPAVPGELH